MINKRAAKYARISSLQEIEQEKIYLRQLIKNQGGKVEENWDAIYDFWSFIPKISRCISALLRKLPVDLGVLSFVFDLLRNRKK
ncbi:MAG: hypothetical protein MJZ72_01680 [Bacteroidales bacterium]|nr:hypothetical protein [Bacteroidales bacterium]